MDSLFSPDEFGGQGDLQMADFDEEPAPDGKKWECCMACGGRGKVLVDDVTFIPRPRSVSVTPSIVGSDGIKSPAEEKRRGNNPFGPKGTLRCIHCQKQKPCTRCQIRHFDCGPKLPPQDRPRAITSVPNDQRRARPVSLNLDVHFASRTDEDTPISAGSLQSAPLHSLPVSPFLFPIRKHLDPPSTSITPIEGSPTTFQFEAFEQNSLGIDAVLAQHAATTSGGVPMSHQNSQHTVTQTGFYQQPLHLNFLSQLDGPEPQLDLLSPPAPDMAQSLQSQYLSPTSPHVAFLQRTTETNNQDRHHKDEATIHNSLQSPLQTPTWDLYTSQQFQNLYPTHQHPPSNPPPHCANCGTVQSRQWRKLQSGNLICNQCGTNEHLLNLNTSNANTIPHLPNSQTPQGPGKGALYWRGKLVRGEAPSFNSVMSDETNGSGSAEVHGHVKSSQESDEPLLFDMQI